MKVLKNVVVILVIGCGILYGQIIYSGSFEIGIIEYDHINKMKNDMYEKPEIYSKDTKMLFNDTLKTFMIDSKISGNEYVSLMKICMHAQDMYILNMKEQ